MSIPTDQIVKDYPLPQFLEDRYQMKVKHGKCLCCFHDDRHPSMTVYQTSRGWRWSCKSCNIGGDIIEFVAHREKLDKKTDFKRICEIITGEAQTTGKPPERRAEPERAVEVSRPWDPIPSRLHSKAVPGAELAMRTRNNRIKTWKPGDIKLVHKYRNPQGEVILMTLRVPKGAEGKDVIPVRYIDGELHWKGFSEDGELSPLYGWDRLDGSPTLPVLVVEGEKCVDALAPILPGYVVVCWQGGASWARADWSQLKGRDVTLFEDFDHLVTRDGVPISDRRQGHEFMLGIREKLKGVASSVKMVDLSDYTEDKYPSGYDVFDMLAAGMRAPDIVAFIEKRTQGPQVPENVQERKSWIPNGWKPVMTSGERPGVKKDDPTNLWLLLLHNPHFKGRFTYDVFDQLVLIDNEPMDGYRLRELRLEITQSKWPLQPKIKDLQESVVAVALRNRTNRFARQLLGLTWDRKRRLQADSMVLNEGSRGLLVDYANCEDKPFNRVIGMRWMVGAAQRLLQDPNSTTGWQHDSILILEGEQGLRKTSFLRVLGSVFGREVYTELQGSLGKDKDDLMKLRGKAIVELAEMTAHRKSDQDAFKAFIDKKVDEYRPPYGAEIIKQPRMVVFAGTTNKEAYLNDPTGARRFWPARVEAEIDTHKLKQDLEQIWAEAVWLAQNGEPNHLQGDDELEWHAEAVEDRDLTEAWEGLFDMNREKPDWKRLEGYTIQQVFHMVGIFDSKDMTPGSTRRLEDMLTRKGFRKRQGNYRSPGQTNALLWRPTKVRVPKQTLKPR